MDINEAALKLAKIEIVKTQIAHLQSEAQNSDSVEYCTDCNEKAQELIQILNLNSIFQ